METTQADPVIAEVRAVRDEFAARADYDVGAIFPADSRDAGKRPGASTSPIPRAGSSKALTSRWPSERRDPSARGLQSCEATLVVPLLHEFAAAVEQVGAPVGGFDSVVVDVERVGALTGDDGEPRLLVRSDAFDEGTHILTSQLTNAVTGLRVRVEGVTPGDTGGA